MTKPLQIECVDKLGPLITTPKRIKILVGGRASTKSTFVADYVLSRIATGQRWCCGREFQNSIDESVHSMMESEIERCGFQGFDILRTEINHASGGKAFYKGLARNITSLKSLNVNGLWIEEGEGLSDQTLKVVTASVRVSAAEAAKARLRGESALPEIWVTMNRGSSKDPIAVKYLERAEPELKRCGYYEDDLMMVVEVNYDDNPWFHESGLEQERLDDKQNLSRAAYDHKWLGAYMDEVENSIIKPEWFDACIDAHKIDRLKKVFEPTGAIVAAHDPSDSGGDAKGLAVRHGSIITHVSEKTSGEIDEGIDWATEVALQKGADWFVWDGDGMGAGAKRQISDAFAGTRTQYHMFRGSLSGSAQDNAKAIYQPSANEGKTKTYSETFLNNRAQFYVELSRRIYNTFKCVEKGEYIDPLDMISFDSDGIENLRGLRSELCRIPRKQNNRGVEQIMTKNEMLRFHNISSPNMGDSVMMSLFAPPMVDAQAADIDFAGW